MIPLFRRAMWWLRRGRKDDELREELRFHLSEEADERRADGASEQSAMWAAHRDLGNVTLLQEDIRTLWTWTSFEQAVQDVRHALRALRHAPAFTAVAVLTLAIGIGVNTAIFSVINAVVLRPLPYRDPGTLVLIDPNPFPLTPAWLATAWRERARTLSGFAGFDGPGAATLVHAGASQQIDTADVTWNFLSFLGVTTAIGRDFVAADADRGAPGVGILSHEFWLRAFGGDPAIVGRPVTITGKRLTVIGVAPAAFRFPTGGSLPTWGVVTDTQPDLLRVAGTNARINVIGRLAPGITATSATEELQTIFQQEARSRFPGEDLNTSEFRAAPLQDRLVGSLQRRLWLVLGAAGFVLLVACANVTNLLLARASVRQRELALRMALGARRGSIARLLLTESTVLALLGSAIAIVFAYAASNAVRALLLDRIPYVDDIRIDSFVLLFSVAVAVIAGIVCGLVALPNFERTGIVAISDSGAPAVAGRSRMRRLLLSAETAVTFVLVVGAALFAQTLWNLRGEDRGFDADRLLAVRVAPGPLDAGQNRSSAFVAFFRDVRNRLEHVPGVASAAAISLGPLEGTGAGFVGIAVNGRPRSPDPATTPIAFATPGYLGAMRIPIVSGRDFNDADRQGADLVAIVNQAFERRFTPNGGIVGSRITSDSGPEVFTVVGVTHDVPDKSLRGGPAPLLMAPLEQMPGVHISWGSLTFVLRTSDGDPLRLAPDVRRAIWAISPNIVITEMVTMNARVAMGMRAERDGAFLFGFFGLAALVMAAIGVYGLAAYSLAQRTKEIGIRLALGASAHDVRRLLVTQTLRPTLMGIGAGAAAAALLTRLVTSMVYGVAPLDPVTFALGAIVLVSVALAATWLPARRATRIDPLVALRHE